MKLFLQNEPDEEASYHAEQVVVAACRPSRTGNKKAIYQRRVDCRDIRYDVLNEKSVKQPQDFVFIVELARQRTLVVQIGLGRARNHAGEALPWAFKQVLPITKGHCAKLLDVDFGIDLCGLRRPMADVITGAL